MFRTLLLSSVIGPLLVVATSVAVAAPNLNKFREAEPMVGPALMEAGRLNAENQIGAIESPVYIPPPRPLDATSASAADPKVGTTPTTLAQRMRAEATGVVNTALNFLGMPYRHGGTSESTGFDCSGFTRYMFEMSVGLVLPRNADQQAKAPGLAAVRRNDLQPGDLVFFNTLRRTFSHVGIYIGDGKFIHAPKPGAEVRVEDMGVAYWAQRFTGARRADPDVDPMSKSSAVASGSDTPAVESQAMTVSAAMPRGGKSAASRRKPVRHNTRRHR